MDQGTFWRPYGLARFKDNALRLLRPGAQRWIDAGPGSGRPYRIGNIGFQTPKSVRTEDVSRASKWQEQIQQIATFQPFGLDDTEAIVCKLMTYAEGRGRDREILVTSPVPTLTWRGGTDEDLRTDRFSGLGAETVDAVQIASDERLRLLPQAGTGFYGAFVSLTPGPVEKIASLDFPPLIQPVDAPPGAVVTTALHLFIPNGRRVQIAQDGIPAELVVDENGELHVFSERFAKRWLR